MKIQVFSDIPGRFKTGSELWLKGEKRKVTSVKTLNDAVVITFDGINTPEDVECFRNELLLIPEEEIAELPEGRFYMHDLVGMQVCSASGEKWGEVKDAINNAGTDVLEIGLPNNKSILAPMVDTVISKIDKENRTIIIDKDIFEELFE